VFSSSNLKINEASQSIKEKVFEKLDRKQYKNPKFVFIPCTRSLQVRFPQCINNIVKVYKFHHVKINYFKIYNSNNNVNDKWIEKSK